MKNKFNLRKLIFIFIGIFFCVIPIEAKAADYEASFKIYEPPEERYANAERFPSWAGRYEDGRANVTEITDFSTIKADSYFILGVNLKTIGNPVGASFSLYFSYDSNIVEPTDTTSTGMLIAYRDPYEVDEASIFGNDSTWSVLQGSVDDKANIAINMGSSKLSPIMDTAGGPAVFMLFKAKKDINDENQLNFQFYTEDRKLIATIDGVTGQFVTMGSTNNNDPVELDTISIIPEKKASGVKTLASINAINGSNKYIDLNWASGSTDTTFNGTIPADINNLTLTIKPFHAAASIEVCPDAACVTTTFSLLANSGIALLSGDADNTLTTTLSNLTTGSNKSYYKVTAENGDEEIYTIDIKKLNDDASLGSVTLTNGITLNYDSATKTYSASNVPFITNKTNISASVTTDSNAVIDSTGTTWNVTSGAITNVEWNLTNTGTTANTGTIKVNAENCDSAYNSVPGNTCTTNTYTVNVNRNEPKTIATLKSLTVNGTLVNGFVPDSATDLEYTLADTTSATLNIAGVVTDNSNATITSGTGSVSLSVGENTFNVVVTAEDGTTTKTYTINVKRLSTDASLKALTVTSSPQGTMEAFFPSTKTYKYVYDETVGNVTINATANYSEAMVQIGNEAATKGSATSSSIDPKTTNFVDVTITAEDGTTDSYRITFERKKSNVNTLKELHVTDSSNKEYITNFNSSTKTYNITVENDITSLNVSAIATSDAAKINNGTNTYTGTINNLGFNNNSHTITVSPEEGTDATYTINVTRKQSTNANLTDLKVDNSSLDGFNGTQNGTYNLNDVDSTKTSVEISYTKENNEAVVAITNNGTNITGNTVNLSEGNNVIVVAVTSQDGSKTIRHTINIKKKSSVASLSNLTATSTPQGTMGSFATATKAYTYIFDETVSSVNINATSTHNEAMISINGEASAKHTASASVTPVDGNSVNIVITAEDGHSTDTYTITFERKKSDVNTLNTLSVKDSSNNEYITNFNSNTKTYNITIPHDVDSLDISAVATSDAANINNGTNTFNDTVTGIEFDTKTVTLTVSPEQGTNAVYTINITRTKSNNANLTDLLVDGTTVNGFNKLDDSTPFDIGSVGNAITSLNITYTQENQYSKVTIEDNNLSVGDNIVKVKVTSQDGTNTREYKIRVRRKSIDVGFASLNVVSNPQGALAGPDASNVYTYTYDRSVTSVDIQATANSGNPVVGIGTHNIASGDATLTVMPEDSTASAGVYTIKFVQELETDSSLSNLEVSKDGTPYTLDESFNPITLNYSLTVGSEVDKVDIAATLNGSYAKKISIDNNDTENPTGTITNEVSLNPGSNTINVVVTAEDNSTTTYTITITRTINTSATLTDLQVDGVQVPDFSSSKTTYNLDAVPYTKDEIEITAVGAAGATVTGDGTKSLVPGDNTFEISVTSQDGNNTAKYTINIRRKLNDAKITNLTSDVGTLNNGSTEFQYTLDIPSGTNNVTLTPTFMAGATLQTPASLTNIDVTNISEIRFTVQAEDTTYTNEYVVTLNKLSSTNNNLASLSVDNGTLTPNFNKDTTKYTVSVDSSVDTINVTAVVEDTGKATLTGDGSHSLNYGDNTITVTVTAEDKSTKEYEIVVTRRESNDTSLSDLTIDGTQIAGFTSTKDTYNITLPFGTTSFVLGATPNDTNASILDSANKLGTMTLTGNTGTFTFEVEAQDGTKKTYTINVTVAGNNDTTIDSLTVLGKTPTWSDANNRYELTVDGETLKVGPNDIVATFGNGASITNKDAEKNLALGGNSYKFTVTAQDGTTTKEVEVYITREASDVNTLDTLTSDVGTFTPSFDKDTNSYKLTLPEGTTEFTISATATSKNPATTVVGTGKYTIPVTDDKVEVIVTAEDGSVNTYEITIEVESSKCTENCDFDGDGVCDLNCDTDGDGVCDLNCDTNDDGKCDINCDTDKDGVCDLNCDSDGDGVCDYNCDTDGDGVCDTNCRLDKIVAKDTGSYTTDDDYVLGIRDKTSFDDVFKGQFDNNPTELILYEKDGNTEVTEGNVGTGMILKLERNGQVLDQKAIVVLGDVNGDGEIDVTDASKVVGHFFDIVKLTDAAFVSGDVNGDGEIDVSDASMMVNHFLENINIFGN